MVDSEDISIGRSLRAGSSDEALGEALRATLDFGHGVDAGGRSSAEVIDMQLRIDKPRDRLIANPRYSMGIVSTVARFVWMMGGNERLQDIAFYQPQVRRFTDDNLIVPGSNYGKRLVAPRPGVNQIEGVIGRLGGDEDGDEPGSSVRRASAVIWQAEDAVRASKDIPCAFGVMYGVREGKLIAKTLMRSNNGPTLLAVNLFEFGLLAEVIATEVGVALGPLIHDAFSFHIYDAERGRAREAVAGWDEISGMPRRPMPPVPGGPSPLAQTRALARLETELTHDLDRVRDSDMDALLSRGSEELNDYWLAFYRVLLVHAICRTNRFTVAHRVAEVLPDHFRTDAVEHIEKLATDVARDRGQLFVEAAQEVKAERDEDATSKLRQLCKEIEANTDLPVTLREYEQLEERFVTGALARRSDEEQFSLGDIEDALRELRRRGPGLTG